MVGKSVSTQRLDRSIIPVIDDPDDQMFVDLAYASHADYIITLDGRSGMLHLTDVPFMSCTPDKYLEIVKSQK